MTDGPTARVSEKVRNRCHTATKPDSGEILHCETNECAVFRTSCIRRRTRKDPSSSETFIKISQSRSSTATNEEVPVGGGWSVRGGAWAVMITLRLRSGGSQAFLHRGQNCNARLRRRRRKRRRRLHALAGNSRQEQTASERFPLRYHA